VKTFGEEKIKKRQDEARSIFVSRYPKSSRYGILSQSNPVANGGMAIPFSKVQAHPAGLYFRASSPKNADGRVESSENKLYYFIPLFFFSPPKRNCTQIGFAFSVAITAGCYLGNGIKRMRNHPSRAKSRRHGLTGGKGTRASMNKEIELFASSCERKFSIGRPPFFPFVTLSLPLFLLIKINSRRFRAGENENFSLPGISSSRATRNYSPLFLPFRSPNRKSPGANGIAGFCYLAR